MNPIQDVYLSASATIILGNDDEMRDALSVETVRIEPFIGLLLSSLFALISAVPMTGRSVSWPIGSITGRLPKKPTMLAVSGRATHAGASTS